jgi:hypothetical protein
MYFISILTVVFAVRIIDLSIIFIGWYNNLPLAIFYMFLITVYKQIFEVNCICPFKITNLVYFYCIFNIFYYLKFVRTKFDIYIFIDRIK